MTTPQRFISGAIDLSTVKAQAEARAQAQREGVQAGGIPTSVVVTAANIQDEVIVRSTQVPVVVLIGTARSPESEQLQQDFTTLAAQANHSFIFGYIDADATPDVAAMFGIQGLPTVVAVASGQPIANFEGGQPRAALEQWTQAVVEAVAGQLTGLPTQEESAPAEDPRFAPATEALNHGDFAQAIAVYESILAQEPKNFLAQQALENAKFLQRLQQQDATTDPIAFAAEHPADLDAQFAAADAHIAAGQAAAAFQVLLDHFELDKAQMRARMLELFALFEATDPIVIQARAAMANKLF